MFAVARQEHDWKWNTAFDAFCRDRDAVEPKGWAHPNPTKTRPPNRALLAVLAPLLVAADMRLPCRDS